MTAAHSGTWITPRDEREEFEFEIAYLRSLSFDDRLALMRERSHEMLRQLVERGHRKPFEIVQRP